MVGKELKQLLCVIHCVQKMAYIPVHLKTTDAVYAGQISRSCLDHYTAE